MAIILVVDDEVGIRELLSEILIDEGYDVRLAENATAARRIRGELRPDLVLLDIWMPDTDGISLLKEWHAAGHLNMPVVMMSGHGTIDTAVEATRIGAMEFLEKPIALQKLLAAVKRGLARIKQVRDLCVTMGIAMTLEDSWGRDIVTAAIAHLADSTPEEFRFTSTDFNSYVTVSQAEGAPQRVNGFMRASAAPRLGIRPRMEVQGAPVLIIEQKA